SQRTSYVRLYDYIEFFSGLFLVDHCQQISARNVRNGHLTPHFGSVLDGLLSSCSLVFHQTELISALSHFFESSHYPMRRRSGAFYRLAGKILQRAHFTVSCTGHHKVTSLKSALLDKKAHHRPTTSLYSSLDNQSFGWHPCICSQILQIGDQ